MSNARKKLVDIIRDHPDETVKLADAIIAALPGLVKPLEWVETTLDYDHRDENHNITKKKSSLHWDASPQGMSARYTIVKIVDERMKRGFKGYTLFLGRSELRFKEAELAKAAAQRHHTAQIMAAFGIDAIASEDSK